MTKPIERAREAIRDIRWNRADAHGTATRAARAALTAALDPEEVELSLIREWHEDQCACREYDGIDIETCDTRQTSRYGFSPPDAWSVDTIIAHILNEGEKS